VNGLNAYEKNAKERMHLDLETDNVEAELDRLEALGATRWNHQVERGFDFWVLRDPWGNEFCVLQPEFPELLARQEPWNQLCLHRRPSSCELVVRRSIVVVSAGQQLVTVGVRTAVAAMRCCYIMSAASQ
jgi:Glyoxalase-like domain